MPGRDEKKHAPSLAIGGVRKPRASLATGSFPPESAPAAASPRDPQRPVNVETGRRGPFERRADAGSGARGILGIRRNEELGDRLGRRAERARKNRHFLDESAGVSYRFSELHGKARLALLVTPSGAGRRARARGGAK